MCAYAIIIIAVFWMTEALPMAATALFPIMLMPFLGVAPSKIICRNYMKDSNFLFVGGLIVAVAIEKWNLHRRIALRVLITVGGTPKWLMMGFMSVTAFLSMWISNTATTAMLIPIVHAVLLKLEEMMNERIGILADEEGTMIGRTTQAKITAPPPAMQLTTLNVYCRTMTAEEMAEVKKYRKMGVALRLGVCVAANIGGTATLTGTGPNIVIQGQMDE
ncbi:hypothetical protein NP493_12g01007 [Ridgeia piscesae]|uniref:Uncharacterized protein n=1 Tax=Ridgeia piscesae TaxID=27915 RepID=A0AAD9PF21_RIDPI|nr:hypothetical protein NP493_12g01007 [Ridgeia piscesae]